MGISFNSIRQSIAAIGSERKRIRNQIETKKQRRDFLQSAPLTRAELTDALCSMIDARGNVYPQRLARGLSGLRGKPFYDYHGSRLDVIGTLGSMSKQDLIPKDNLTWFLGDAIKSGVKRAVEVMPWPDDDVGPPLAERQTEIDKLTKEIDELEKAEAELQQEATAAGLRID